MLVPTFLYGSEVWTEENEYASKIRAAEIKLLRSAKRYAKPGKTESDVN
jgi:hypothetical protein